MAKNKKEMPDPFADIDMESNMAPKSARQAKPKPTKRPRQGLGEELIEVYESTGDDFRVMSTFEHKARTWQRVLAGVLVFVVLLFVGVATISYFIWGRQPIFDGEQVVFDIQAPEDATSGSTVTYVVHYANKESVNFSRSEIELRYPAGFDFVRANPEPISGENLFSLGSVSAGKEDTIEVEGVLVGRPEQDATISGVWRYWPANFSSEFQEVASSQTRVAPVKIDARIEGPDQVLVGQKTTYTVIYNNTGEEPVQNLRFEALYPNGFVVDSAKPELQEENRYLLIPELAPNQETELQIDGFYSLAADQPVDFIVELAQQATEDEYFTQKRLTHTTKIIRGDLVVNMVANGSAKDSSLQWGNTVNGSITFQNNSEATLSDLQVVAKLESRYRTEESGKGSQGALDWSTLIDSAKGALKEQPATDAKSLRVRTITWTADDVAELEKLEPKQEGGIDFQISLYDLAAVRKHVANPGDVDIVLSVEVSVGKTGGVQEQLKVIGNPIRFSVNTDLVMAAQARYFDEDGNQVGSGPLPPEVGERTKYRVYWDLTNSLHEVQDVLVSTDLPDNVSWINSFEVSAGEVVFSASNNTLSWRLNRIPLDVQHVTLAFDVEVSPTSQQAGKTAPLTKKVTMTAVDTVTSGKIIQSISPLTTAVEHDEEAADRGIVVQ